MKKTIMAMAMAAMAMMTTGTALVAASDRGYIGDSAPCYETSDAHCGGGYYGGCRGRRGSYGCGGYCWSDKNNNEG